VGKIISNFPFFFRSAVAGQTATMVLKQEIEEHTESQESLETVPENDRTWTDTSYSSPNSSSINRDIDENKDSIRRSRPSTSITSAGAGSGLVLLSPACNPVAYWEFEVSKIS
jgi:hypothetical protein